MSKPSHTVFRIFLAGAYAAGVVALLALLLWLIHLPHPPTGEAGKIGEIQKSSLERVDALSAHAFTLAIAIVGGLGAVLLGLGKAEPLKTNQKGAMVAAVFFCLASVIGGIGFHANMLRALSENLVPSPQWDMISAPLNTQYYGLLFGIVSLGWFIVDKSIRKEEP